MTSRLNLIRFGARAYTGQDLDDTGLLYDGARDDDPTLGRFVSPDTLIP